MTREETLKLVQIIQAAFPKWEVENKTGLVDVWTTVCEDDDFNALQLGLKNYIKNDTTGFAPSIGQIRNGIKRTSGDYDDTEEMIGLLRKAIKNGNYGYAEEYALLPPTLQKAIGCAENIRAWAAQPTDQFESVTLSAVRRAYRATKQHEEDVKSALPVTQIAIEKTKDNIQQLETPKAVLLEAPLPEVKVEKKAEDLADEIKEAVIAVWNIKDKQTIYTFHFKDPHYRDNTKALIEKYGLEQFLRHLEKTTADRYLLALKEIEDAGL